MSTTPPPPALTDAHEAEDSPIRGLYPPADAAAKKRLLEFVTGATLGFGSWRYLKGLYKRVEADALAGKPFDADVLGALIARLDAAPLRLDPAGTAGRAELGRAVSDLRGVAAAPGGRLFVQASSYNRGYVEKVALFDPAAGRDPLKPKSLGHTDGDNGYTWAQHGAGRPVQVSGGFGYTMFGDYQTHRLTCWDLSGDGAPKKRGKFETDQEVLSHAVAADAPVGLVLIGTGRRGGSVKMITLDLSDPDHPTARGNVDMKANAQSVALSEDGRAAVLAVPAAGFSWTSLPKPGGLRFYDLSDQTRPAREAASVDRNGVNCLAVSSGFAYVGVHAPAQNGEPSGIYVYDLADPKRRTGFLPFEGEDAHQAPVGLTVDATRRLLYVGRSDRALLIVDIADPLRPRLLCEVAEGGGASLALLGDVAYSISIASYRGAHASVLDITDPARAFRVGVSPSEDTIAYMKRRTRRLLKTLAVRDAGRYAEAAAGFLRAAGDPKRYTVDRAVQWTAMDVLFGGANRWQQRSHGRGPYILRDKTPHLLALRRREERAPAAWDARPDLLAGILAAPDLPYETYEMAARALFANRAAIPATLPDRSLKRFLVGNAPLLVRVAVGQVAARMTEGKAVDPALAADAVLRAGAARRRQIDAAVPGYAGRGDDWAGKFVARVLEAATMSLTDVASGTARLSRRAAGALALVARRFPESAEMTAEWGPLLAPGLAARRDDLTPFLLGLMERGVGMFTSVLSLRSSVIGAAAPDLESLLAGLPEDLHGPAVDALVRGMTGQEVAQSLALSGVQSQSNAVRAAMWKMLAASATAPEVLATVWNYLFDVAVTETPALRTAMGSPEALAVLARSGITPDQVAARLAAKPFLVGLLSPETFASVAREAPAGVVLSLVAAAPDELWARLRDGLVRALREGFGLAAFWKAAPAALEADADDRLAGRLLGDPEIADTFLGIDDAEAALSIRDAAFGPLLARYVERHLPTWPRDSEILLTAAAHALPEVREPAVARILALGTGLAFALRLLESEVPDAVGAGRAHFERTGVDGEAAFTDALALCDSPVASVRAYGRRYVTARWDALPRADLYRALFENPAPEMQAFVATLLNEDASAAEALAAEEARFDGEVLRTRNRARRAKEAVKARQDRAEAPTVDVPTLLALARGADGTPRDAEWALAQLTRLALSGVEIEGFAVVEG
jgi:hypothetical protein